MDEDRDTTPSSPATMMQTIRPIRTEKDYDWALAEIAPYFETQPEPGTPEGDRFEILATLIEAYEARVWPIEAPDPIEAVRDRMREQGLKSKDLARLLGSKSRASEVLARRRPLTIEMIRRISAELRIPAEILIQPYHLATVAPRGQKADA